MPSSLSDAFKSHPVHLADSHIHLETLREVPDSHAWPSISDYPSADLPETQSIPIIDLLDENTVKLVGNASEKWGVFQVINHGVPMHLLEEVESQTMRLFFLPTEQKLKAARAPDGITGYGRARISKFFTKQMWSEGFTILNSPEEHVRQLWPQDYQNFCDIMEEYKKEMKKLSTRLMWIMMGSLGISKEDLKWAELEGSSGALQLNSYPPCPEPHKVMGLAAHTDSTFVTVLHQNNTTGLQVLKDGDGDGDGWVTVPPIKGALVVNVGDLLHILSNGRYPSVLHRAVVHHTRHRISVAYLYGPPADIQISPLSKLVDQEHPPLYRNITWKDYLGLKAQHFNNALSSIRL